MHFCDTNHEITQIQQQENEPQRREINCMPINKKTSETSGLAN